MAVSTKQQLVRLYSGGLSLPAVSFIALITGFTFSLTVPFCLQALIPAMESLFFVSLPHLWRASLSWITPPCLFVLLNGIIMILTATSGRSSASSDGGSFEVESSLATQIETVAYKQNSASLVEPHVLMSDAAPILDNTLQLVGPLDIHIPVARSLHVKDAEEVELLEPLQETPTPDGYGDDKQIVLYVSPQEASTGEMDPELESVGDDTFTSSSAACEEMVKGGSVPSSPQFSCPTMKNAIRRSISIDSATFIDNDNNNEGAAESEQLSEEAFKKRIDDFIFKVNLKIRSETRVV